MTRPPWDYEWEYGYAPPPDIDGLTLWIKQDAPGDPFMFVGLIKAQNGMWMSEKSIAPWGTGVPRCWWTYYGLPPRRE